MTHLKIKLDIKVSSMVCAVTQYQFAKNSIFQLRHSLAFMPL